jgi:hypothetical protein
MKFGPNFLVNFALVSASILAADAAVIPISENGTAIGSITINAVAGGVQGNFQATDNLGNAITLAQLATNMGEDHFNWLQFLTPTNAFLGVGAGTTFVDPQSTGQGTLWADTLPWYWDEVAPPNPLPAGRTAPPTYIPGAGSTELADMSTGNGGSQLSFADFPGGPVANTLDFTTCLVSVGPGNSYKPLGGFTWTATIGNPGTLITAGPNAGCTSLTPAQTSLVRTSFPGDFQQVPEPGTIAFLMAGLTGLVAMKRKRHNVN